MDFKLVWTPLARDDLREIVSYIARDSPAAALRVGFRAGAAAGAKQEKGKWGWMGRFPRAPVAATSALGYGLVAPAGRHGRTKSLQATAATASVDRFMNFEHLCCSRHGGYGGCA